MNNLRIGFLLGFRQIQRSSIWTTLLIIFVMMLTFLNLIAVSGVLVGLIVGAETAVRDEVMGDIILSPLDGEDHILQTPNVVKELDSFTEIAEQSVRYQGNAIIEAGYKERRDLSAERDTAAVIVKGIDPVVENKMTGLADNIIEGKYLEQGEEGYILIGIYYIKEYAEEFGDVFDTVSDISPGDTVRMTIGEVSKEFIVKGIVKSKVDEVNLSTFIPDREFRRVFGRLDRNADQIVIRLKNPSSNGEVKNAMLKSGLGAYTKIQTFEEGLPKFITDIKNTFNILGNFIGSIGIVVASITIFIIIFINALSRRKHIDILKGIGIERSVIETAYVIQAAFYALMGSLLGTIVTYGLLLPYFDKNPIKFPFSDGILVADPEATFWKFIILFIITIIAGFIPAWMIASKNTLDSILGRK